ncbi:Deoxynucleoside kinase [Lucilia cuprina]|uniref:Deoxynucleoside kinase n=1 Tax=Lucilia cuprina TaxID=7375 RepID=A0A0L0C989_LUCCU|nr:deoxynucleoside kinase isoform X2 [Lucilia cuprina]KNC27974.1 Deoxynucleoside kinase [Lucilia cuprina]
MLGKFVGRLIKAAATMSANNTACGTKPLQKFAANSQPFTVLIEGNIGSGKTTFLNHFEQFQDKICLITEPVEKWRNVRGVNLLELMYKEPERWAMPFQSYVTLTMLQSHTLQTEKPVKLMERSIYSSKHCFVENMFRNKIIDAGMYHVLQEWYRFIEDSIHIRADLIVYLRTSPEVVYERMRKRARSEESCVPLKYLEELHKLHEEWLIKNRGYNTNVIVLNADLDLEHIGSEYKRYENHIINPMFTQQPQAVLVSPSKRRHME